jgi:hypothetical protein
MDLQRARVSPDGILQYFHKLSIALDGIPSSFIWNMDEMEHVDSSDAHPDIIYVREIIDWIQC